MTVVTPATSAAGARHEPQGTSDLWWKDAVLYCLDVETFYDADGDGCGDLPGLTEASTTCAASASAACG
jgi:hypothetical protein